MAPYARRLSALALSTFLAATSVVVAEPTTPRGDIMGDPDTPPSQKAAHAAAKRPQAAAAAPRAQAAAAERGQPPVARPLGLTPGARDHMDVD